jgi:hypothetical protein
MAARLFYVHWDKDEALAACRGLREAGFNVRCESESGDAVYKEIKKSPPDALVISLAKQPSHGRQVAGATMQTKSLEGLRVIFVGGADDVVAETRKEFPDAVYCSWAQLKQTLAKKLGARPTAGVTAPPGVMTRTARTRPGVKTGTLAVQAPPEIKTKAPATKAPSKAKA